MALLSPHGVDPLPDRADMGDAQPELLTDLDGLPRPDRAVSDLEYKFRVNGTLNSIMVPTVISRADSMDISRSASVTETGTDKPRIRGSSPAVAGPGPVPACETAPPPPVASAESPAQFPISLKRALVLA